MFINTTGPFSMIHDRRMGNRSGEGPSHFGAELINVQIQDFFAHLYLYNLTGSNMKKKIKRANKYNF